MGFSNGKEIQPKNSVDSLNKDQLNQVIFQMENCICKIKLDNGSIGTGFFCLIPFPNKSNPLTVLITCNHVLNENNLAEGAKINFSLNDDKIEKSITISNSRKTFTDEEKDVTFIEIKPEDNIKDESILNIDEKIFKDDPNKIYEKKAAYIVHYEEGKVAKHSLGKINYIDGDKYTINHNCKTLTGSSGSPIINLMNFNVIGVHKGYNNRLNLGTLLKIPIDDFYKLYKDNNNKESKGKNSTKSAIEENNKNEENKNPIPNPNNGKISVILEDENQKDYSLICFKTDKFSSLEEKLFQKEPSLRNKKLCYIINNKIIDISKIIEENNIKDGSTIYFKIIKNDTNLNNSLVNNKKKTEKKISNEKISVIITDEYQKDYSFICRKSDIFSSLEEKLFEKDPSLRNKKHCYIVNNQKIDISKTIEENNIVDGSNIYYKSDEDEDKPEPQIDSIVTIDNIKKENNIINEKMSVIIEDEEQNAYSFICRKTDKFSSLEKKLFKKVPSLKGQRHYYTINNKSVYFYKTLEENNIVDGSIIYYKIDDEDYDDEFMAVIFLSTGQDIKIPIACKKTDKFKVLEEKLYEKKPDLKNINHYYLCGGNQIYVEDVEKTLEMLNIKDCDKIMINNIDSTTIVN